MNRDAEQIAAVLRGDRHAFTGLVQRHKNAVYGLAFSFLKDFEAARDISQEVFLRAFLQLPRLEQTERFPAWLCAITANTCRNWSTSTRRSCAWPKALPSSPSPCSAWRDSTTRAGGTNRHCITARD